VLRDTGASRIRTRCFQTLTNQHAIRPDVARQSCAAAGIVDSIEAQSCACLEEELFVLAKVFPIKLTPGKQAEVEAIVEEFAPKGPAQEPGTLSFRVYRDPEQPDYLLFVEHFADQAAYDAHTGSDAYKELIAGRFASLITEFVEVDHELVVSI
jgi:quinol monooxygenase YgiN